MDEISEEILELTLDQLLDHQSRYKKLPYLPVPYALLKIFKNANIVIYLAHLRGLSNHFSKKYGEKGKWFFVIPEKLQKDLPIFNQRTRTTFDRDLESIGFIKTKFEGVPRRKWYQINRDTVLKSALAVRQKLPNLNGTDDHAITNNHIQTFSFQEKDVFAGKNGVSSSRVLKRRKTSPVDKVIEYWSDLGPPFARVVKPDSIRPLLVKLSKKDKPREIIKVIERSLDYIKSPVFKFKTNGNFGIKTFFKRDSYSVGSEFLRANRASSWYMIFKLKGDTWLEENLLKVMTPVDPELESFLKEVLPVGNNGNDKTSIISGSKNMISFMKVNSYPRNTMLVDFKNFLRDNYPDARDFKLWWLKAPKFWNTQFARYLVNYGRFKNLGEVKEI